MIRTLKLVTSVVLIVAPLYAALPAAPEQKPAAAAKPTPEMVSRGELLYENHCIACHESTAHIRHDRRAKSLPALEGWVIRWSNQQRLNWNAAEITDVVDYLNRRYYKFPLPSEKK